ncbi:unnamed protein product [Ectocarpus sp. 6 AP-2014]
MPPKNRESKPLLLENQTHKRRDRAQELRSARRQGVLAKRRKFDSSTAAAAAAAHQSTTAATGVAGGASAQGQQEEPWSRERLESAIRGVRERPVSQVLPFLVELRKLLSLEDPPVEEVVERGGLAPRLIELLSTPHDEVQLETTWCLTNIASSYSRHTRTIVGAAPQLISFLSAPNPALQEQALWALGNIAGDSDDFRRMLRANGALLPMFRLLQNPPLIEIARTAAWAISNLARGDETPGQPFVQAAPTFVASLRGGVRFSAAAAAAAAAAGAGTGAGAPPFVPPRDEALRVEAAWILAFLTAKEEETVTELVRVGMVPALVEALVDSGGQDPLCTPALRTLGNMVSGKEEWADAVMLHKEFLPCLDAVLKSQDRSQRVLVKEAAWVASNVAAGRREHREALVAQGSPAALTLLLLSDQLDLQQEAAHGIWNIVAHDSELLLQAAKDDRVMGAYVALVRAQSPTVVRCALSFLQLVCQNVPGGPRMVESAGGLEAIDDVHYSGQADPELQEAAGAIVDRFFGDDGYESSDEGGDEETDTETVVGGGDGFGFNFGGSGDTSQNGARGPPGQQQQQQQQPLAPLGRGAHLTRPSWMNQNPS